MSFVSLKIFKNSKLIQTKVFSDDQISIGSSQGLSLQLENISPWHVLIEKKHDKFLILDLDSDTGTKLNGKSIEEETLINSGDKIEVGDYTLEFFIVSKKEDKKEKKISKKQSQSKKEEVDPRSISIPSIEEEEGESLEKQEKSFPKINLEEEQKRRKDKGIWSTYAPKSRMKDMEECLKPSVGSLIEVVVCWKERALASYHFRKKQDVFMGSGKSCQIPYPNLISQAPYKLLSISTGVKVFVAGQGGVLIQGKDEETRKRHDLSQGQTITLKPYEMVKVNLTSSFQIYVRLTQKTPVAPLAGVFNLRVPEALALFLAVMLTGFLVFYGSLYAPVFLAKDVDLIEKDIRIAKIVFEPRKQVAIDLNKKTTPVVQKIKLDKPQPKPRAVKKAAVKVKKPQVKSAQRLSNPRKSKQGKLSATAPGKKKSPKKVKVGSVRPGGSLKTGKKGSSAKTKAPDPSKVGLLGAFGGGGSLDKLDKGATGPGGLLGMSEQNTGYGGTEESYSGEGVGTKIKDEAAGGTGSSFVGLKGIKTTGKGLGTSGTGTGGLGKRARLSMKFGSDDLDASGSIDRAAILKVLKDNQPLFARCYDRVSGQSAVQGNLVMQWIIQTSGKGSQAKAIDNKVGSRALASCVADVLEKLNFPKPPSGQIPKVSFTFRFYL